MLPKTLQLKRLLLWASYQPQKIRQCHYGDQFRLIVKLALPKRLGQALISVSVILNSVANRTICMIVLVCHFPLRYKTIQPQKSAKLTVILPRTDNLGWCRASVIFAGSRWEGAVMDKVIVFGIPNRCCNPLHSKNCDWTADKLWLIGLSKYVFHDKSP